MTSEGQQAGQQAEATSGDGFPPDTDGRRAADEFPHSYGPPPQATPGGGSPFVVPAVPPFGQPPADRYGVPAAPPVGPPPSGSARVPQGSARVPQQPAAPYQPQQPNQLQQPAEPPHRGSATDLFRGPAGAEPPARSAWAPPPTVGDQNDFDGGPGRPPGISAFGDQRVRVPGATLADLPDASNESPSYPGDDLRQRGSGPEIVDRSDVPGDSSALPRRVASDDPTGFGAPNRGAELPRRTASAESNLPVRGGNRVPYGMESTFGGFTPARGEQPAARRPFEPSADSDPGKPPYADQPLAALARRGDPGTPPFSPRGAVSYGSPAAPTEQPPTDEPTGRAVHGEASYGYPTSGGPGEDQLGRPTSGEPALSRPMSSPSGFAQRVPGASFGPDAPASPFGTARPVSARGPGEATPPGTARPVSASASVPMGSRVGPADGGDAPPPPAQTPQARVYGRPAQPAAQESAVVMPFARAGTADPIDGVSRDLPPLGPRTPPPGGGRATPVRATASARVAPPQPTAPGQDGPPFQEFTTDVAGRGRTTPPAQSPDNYGENTTDMAGRGPSPDKPYVPAGALPSMHARPALVDGFPPAPTPEEVAQKQSGVSPDRPRLGGLFPGPTTGPATGLARPGMQSRATVTPPGPDETSSWPDPGGAVVPEQGRFDQFKPDAEAAPKPETPRVRLAPVILAVILGAVLVVGVPTGIVWLIARGSDTGFSAVVGDCVQRNGDQAVKATCGDPNTFSVVSVVEAKEKCADPGQPFVVNPTDDGKSQVLCLKPSS